MLKSKEALFTDQDPAGPVVGRVLKQGEAGAKFRLVGEGGVIADDIAQKFKLKAGDGLEEFDQAKENAAQEEANRATYETNANRIGALITPAAALAPAAPVSPPKGK